MAFSFMTRLHRGTSIRRKLSIIAVIATVPTAILLYAVLRNQSADATVARDEAQGVEYVLPLERLLQRVEQHRGLGAAFFGGDVTYADRFAQQTAAVDEAMKGFLAADKKYGQRFKTGDRAQVIAQDWDALKAKSHSIGARESSDLHSAFIRDDIIPLIYAAGNNSGLLLDPTAPSYHLAVAVAANIPAATESVDRARAYGVAPLVHRGKGLGVVQLSTDDQDALNGYFGEIDATTPLAIRELQAAVAADHGLASSLSPRIQDSVIALSQFRTVANASLFQPQGLQGDPGPYIDAATKAIDSMFALSTASSEDLHKLLNTRVSNADRTITISLVVAVGGVGIATLLMVLVVINITRRVGRLVVVADRISLGELDAEVDVYGNDEIGELAASLGRMQSSLEAAITRLRARRAS